MPYQITKTINGLAGCAPGGHHQGSNKKFTWIVSSPPALRPSLPLLSLPFTPISSPENTSGGCVLFVLDKTWLFLNAYDLIVRYNFLALFLECLNKKLRYREEHSASVLLSWCCLLYTSDAADE